MREVVFVVRVDTTAAVDALRSFSGVQGAVFEMDPAGESVTLRFRRSELDIEVLLIENLSEWWVTARSDDREATLWIDNGPAPDAERAEDMTTAVDEIVGKLFSRNLRLSEEHPHRAVPTVLLWERDGDWYEADYYGGFEEQTWDFDRHARQMLTLHRGCLAVLTMGGAVALVALVALVAWLV